MKKNLFNLKNLFKNEFEVSLAKIILTLIVYLFIAFILKAGYEFQRLVDFKSKQTPVKVEKINYNLIFNNKKYEVVFNGTKDTLSIIGSQPEIIVDYLSYYNGIKIVSLNKLKNIKIEINGEILKDNFIKSDLEPLKENSTVEITAY